MKPQFALVSDLHIEGSNMDLHTGSARLLAAVGDIHAPMGTIDERRVHPGVEWLNRKCPDIPVLYVPGNHDYEGNRFDVALDAMRHSAEGTNVVVLCNDTFDFEGVRFLGTPLFTDFSFDGELTPEYARNIQLTTDMKRSYDHDGRALTAEWMVAQHQKARAFLEEELERDPSIPKIVLTHWCPLRQMAKPEGPKDSKSGYWISPCEDLVEQAELWCHGHVHRSVDIRIGRNPNKGRVVANARGFSKLFNIAQNSQFRQPYLLDVPAVKPVRRLRA